MNLSRPASSRSSIGIILYDDTKDANTMSSARPESRTLHSNAIVSSAAKINSLLHSRSSNSSSSFHSRRDVNEQNRVKVIATADFRCTNPIIHDEIQEDEVMGVSTRNAQVHSNVTSAKYRNAVNPAESLAQTKGGLPVGSARLRETYNSVLPSSRGHTERLVIQGGGEEEKEEDQHNTYPKEFQQQCAAQLNECRAQFQNQNTYAKWTCCGWTPPHAFLRLCTAMALVPLVVCGLNFWPVLTVAMLTTILLCVCCYEHAWLSFRIRSRLLVTYYWYESNDDFTDAGDFMGGSVRSDTFQICGYQDGDEQFNNSVDSSCLTHPSISFPTGVGAPDYEGGKINASTSNGSDSVGNSVAATDVAVHSKVLSASVKSDTSRGILVSMANTMFCDNLCLARVVFAAFISVCWSLASTIAFPLISFPVASTPSDIISAPYYFWVVNFVASFCAANCPTWTCAISLVVQKSAFEVVLMNALNCPLAASVDCFAAPITSLQSFALGAMALIMVHALSARGPANLVVDVMLDMLGYAYIVGSLGLLVTMVDSSDHKSTWATLWLGMLGAMWVAQFAGYVCDTIMSRFQLSHIRLLPSRIVVRLNVEASICAIVASSLAFVHSGSVFDIPGGVLPKVLFSISSVIMARFGHLVIMMLKKAAGVRWSGHLMPGFGGALDGAHALFFTSIVFVKYYLFVIARQASEIDARNGNGINASWATVSFSTDLNS